MTKPKANAKKKPDKEINSSSYFLRRRPLTDKTNSVKKTPSAKKITQKVDKQIIITNSGTSELTTPTAKIETRKMKPQTKSTPENNVNSRKKSSYVSKQSENNNTSKLLYSTKGQVKNVEDSKTKTSTTGKENLLAIYDFECDSTENSKPITKKRGRKPKIDVDTSGETENSMKQVVKKLRRLSRKAKLKKNKLVQQSRNNNNKECSKDKNSEKLISSTDHKNVQVKVNPKRNLINNTEVKKLIPSMSVSKPKKSNKIIDNVNKQQNILLNEIRDNAYISMEGLLNITTDAAKAKEQKNALDEILEITNSFLEDLPDDNTNTSDNVNKFNKSKFNFVQETEEIFNSTLTEPASTPWRIPSVTSISVASPRIVTRKKNKTNLKSNLNNLQTSNKVQTSMLNFINNSTEQKLIVSRPVNIFNDISPIKKMPGKVLGLLNSNQIKSLNTSDDSLFGFSVTSKSSRSSCSSENKENNPKVNKTESTDKLSKNSKSKDNQLMKIDLNPVPKVNPFMPKVDENTPVEEEESLLLFQEPKVIEHDPKRFSRQYVRKYPKRKRNVSEISVYSDDEEDLIECIEKKQKNVRSKKEEQEAEKLACLYNSMFEEIEKHPLIIE